MPNPARVIALLLPLLLAPGLARAEVYKCKDKAGRIQYTQTKPRGAECEGVTVSGPKPIGTDVDSLMKFSKEIDKSRDRKSTRLNSSHIQKSRMPSSA